MLTTTAGERILAIREQYVSSFVAAHRDHLSELLVEVVRSLDYTAYAVNYSTASRNLLDDIADRRLMLTGSATALRALLTAIDTQLRTVFWMPSDPKLTDVANRFLVACGRLANLYRLVCLESYGLAKTTFVTDEHLVLTVLSDTIERIERDAGQWMRDIVRCQVALTDAERQDFHQHLKDNIGGDGHVLHEWWAHYNPNQKADETFQRPAEAYAGGFYEQYELPATSKLGNRNLSEWNAICIKALGHVVGQISYAEHLINARTDLNPRNLFTNIVLNSELKEIWSGDGEGADNSCQLIEGMVADAETFARAEANHEIATPQYIQFGHHQVLRPIFGALLNPFSMLLSDLRIRYQGDWDRAVNLRENELRAEIRALLPTSRYTVLPYGVKLKRPDGSQLTDVDTVIVDHNSGQIGLLQLKCYDVYGRSLAERESRRKNTLKANEWVKRIKAWIGNRSCADVGKALGQVSEGQFKPKIIVLTRHVGNFSHLFDKSSDAIWTSWPQLVHAFIRLAPNGFFESLDELETSQAAQAAYEPTIRVEAFPSLKVECRVG